MIQAVGSREAYLFLIDLLALPSNVHPVRSVYP